jgi:hypothetical protein
MPRIRWWTLGLAFVLGCGSKGTVNGTVTYNGKAVADGWVILNRADGSGQAVGGPIHDGQFEVRNVTPGLNQVRVVEVSHTMPDPRVVRLVMEARAKGTRIPAEVAGRKVPPPIPPEASAGLNVDVVPGRQRRDFALQKPKK